MSTASAAIAIAKDPHLGEVANLVLELQEIESKADPSVSTGAGIGLRTVVKPLRAFVYVRRRPWVLPLGATLFLGGIFVAGVLTGKKWRK